MVVIYKKKSFISPSEDEAYNIKGAHGVLKCKSPPVSGFGDQNTLLIKPPGPDLKIIYKPRKGIKHSPPEKSHPGGESSDFATYGSITRGSPIRMELLNGWIVPASLHNFQDGRIIPMRKI